MASDAFNFVEKVIDHLKSDCSRYNIDPSDFILEGNVCVKIQGKPYSKGLEIKTSLTLVNKKPCNPDDYETYSKLARIQKYMNYSYHHQEKCKVNLIQDQRVGEKFLPVKSRRFDTNEEIFLNNQNGITVIFFWGDDLNSDLDTIFMSTFIEAIERNFSKWNGKVKIFTSCKSSDDEQRIKIKNLIEKNNLNKFPEIIQHMHRDEDEYAECIYDFERSPYAIIADTNGILRKKEFAYTLDLENTVNQILEKDELINEQSPCSSNSWNMENSIDKDLADRFYLFIEEAKKSYNEVGVEKKDFIDNMCSSFTKEKERGIYNMGLRINYEMSFIYNMKERIIENVKTHEVGFSISCKNKEQKIFENLIKKYYSKEEVKNNNIKLELIETFDIQIPENKSCSTCQSKIAEEDLTYHCPECKLFFCSQCVDSRKDKSGFEALVHKEHYLIVFKNPKQEYLQDIEKYKLGKNLFAQMKEEELSREHSFGCNGVECCDGEEFNERFICLNCKPGCGVMRGFLDCCRNCFEKMIDFNSQPDLKSEEHMRNHVYLNMIYNGKSYFNY